MANAKQKHKPKRKTITFAELERLAFCNSKKLPRKVWMNGELREWVGIGWIPIDSSEADGSEPEVVDD